MRCLVFFLLMAIESVTFGQVQSYVSTVDSGLTIKSVAVVPLVDNVNSVYASSISEYLGKLISEDRQWILTGDKIPPKNPEEYEESQKAAQAVLKKHKVDAFFTGRITKGPRGISLSLTLVGGADGLPLVRDGIDNFSGFETEDLRMNFQRLYESLKSKLPYQGEILSRKGQIATLNLGSRHGVKEGDEILVVLISRIERHPRFQFITKANREIMGKVKIYKVDESISFASIIEERTANLIQPRLKVARDTTQSYPAMAITADGKPVPQIGERADHSLAFGERPKEYKSLPRANFGRVGLLAGLSSSNLATTNRDFTAAQSTNLMTPTILLEGEMWLDPNWQFNLDMEQLTAKVANGRSGSTPDPLNLQLQKISLGMGYNFLANSDFFGPKFQIQAGYSTANIFVDDSAPRAHTTKIYSGLFLSLGGSIPLETEGGRRYLLGGKFVYHMAPSVSESPASSGSANNQISSFQFFGEMNISENIFAKASLLFEQTGSSFSGGGASSASSSSANFTTLLGGIGYLF